MGRNVLVNTAKGRVKTKNLEREPRVALTIVDPENPYRHLGIQGRVAEITESGADAHIDKMAKKYLGKDTYPFRARRRGSRHRQDRAGQGLHHGLVVARASRGTDLHVFAVPGLPDVTRGADLAALIGGAAARTGRAVEPGDVFVVAQKIVSKAEGALVRLDEVMPSPLAEEWAAAHGKDPRVVEVIFRESRRIVRMERGILIAETRHGFVCANAGVDASNVTPGFVTRAASRSGCVGRTAARRAGRAVRRVPWRSSSPTRSGGRGAKGR